MEFAFFPLRFEFIAKDPLFFPPGQSSNILRGALGIAFRRLACVPQCHSARTCPLRGSCPYAHVFEPGAHGAAGPSGLAQWPRPFVFRARHLDGHTLEPGQRFYFDLQVFSLDPAVLAWFLRVFDALARQGFGPNRGRAELQPASLPATLEPVRLNLSPLPSAPERIRVHFLSPTELKHHDGLASRPDFSILFSRVRDRIGTLSRLYGAGPLAIDYLGTNTRAAAVCMTACHLRRDQTARRSTRTGQCHSIGGFLGTAEYEGDLAEFLPWLHAAKWTGVGRQSVWGKGEISIDENLPPCSIGPNQAI